MTDLVLFDGDCGVCDRIAAAMTARHGPEAAIWRPWQREAALPAGLTADRLAREIVLVRGDGAVVGGAMVFAALWRRMPGWRLVGAALAAPGIRTVAALAYRMVASRRRWLSQRLGLRACALPLANPERVRNAPD
jgi:predicted DCC family thiol-disulfide oxidoreductase YuxK